MRKLSCTIMTIATVSMLLAPAYSVDRDYDDRIEKESTRISALASNSSSSGIAALDLLKEEDRVESKPARASRPGLLKTLMVWALLVSSPDAVQAQTPPFSGYYFGSISQRHNEFCQVPAYGSNILNINSIIPYNDNHDRYPTYVKNISMQMNVSSFQHNYNPPQSDTSDFDRFYITTVRLCNKTFNTIYTAVTYWLTPYSNQYVPDRQYDHFVLSVYPSLTPYPQEDNPQFEETFNEYMSTGVCPSAPAPTPYSSSSSVAPSPDSVLPPLNIDGRRRLLGEREESIENE